MIYLLLFYEFFKTGLFAVGGGMATLPFLYDMSSRYPAWFSHEQLADMIAISESTPGPIGVNMATFVGFTTAGIPGSIIATLGLITPSIIVILIVAAFLAKFRQSRSVEAVFTGLRPCSLGLIAAAGTLVLKISVFDIPAFEASGVFTDIFKWKAIILAAVLVVLTRFVKKTKKLHPIIFIAFSAVAGIILKF